MHTLLNIPDASSRSTSRISRVLSIGIVVHAELTHAFVGALLCVVGSAVAALPVPAKGRSLAPAHL